MLNYLKNEANRTFTENGAVTYESSMSDCLAERNQGLFHNYFIIIC